mmetsp:Transcript_4115/g.14375  ORF Transcript_4115/g.14375 Transcript_4115/m.14375 type:complete len:288 (-) Transcript_4115:1070-1933(-)
MRRSSLFLSELSKLELACVGRSGRLRLSFPFCSSSRGCAFPFAASRLGRGRVDARRELEVHPLRHRAANFFRESGFGPVLLALAPFPAFFVALLDEHRVVGVLLLRLGRRLFLPPFALDARKLRHEQPGLGDRAVILVARAGEGGFGLRRDRPCEVLKGGAFAILEPLPAKLHDGFPVLLPEAVLVHRVHNLGDALLVLAAARDGPERFGELLLEKRDVVLAERSRARAEGAARGEVALKLGEEAALLPLRAVLAEPRGEAVHVALVGVEVEDGARAAHHRGRDGAA